MKLDLSQKRALICGSSEGLGLACAIEIAELGGSVTLLSRSADRLAKAMQKLPPKGSHSTIVCDLERSPDVAALCQKLAKTEKPYHILVNNSGGPVSGLPTESKEEDYHSAA